MDSELFYGFLNKLFILQTQHIEGPKLLILDGHGSHLSIDSINLCRRKNIHMYWLPPHATHVFQPLYVVILHQLKPHFNRLTQDLKLATLGWKGPTNCCKTNFAKLFKQSLESMTVALIKTGFRRCGIFPPDRSQIDTSRLSGHSSNPPPPPTSSNPNQTSSSSFIGDTSQQEVNNFIGDTSRQEVNNFIGDTSQLEVNNFIGDTFQQEVNNLIGDTSQQEVSNTTTSSTGETSEQEVTHATQLQSIVFHQTRWYYLVLYEQVLWRVLFFQKLI